MNSGHPCRPENSRDRIQILTTLNKNYMPQLKVLLTSIHISQPDDFPDIWLMHSGLSEDLLDSADRLCRFYGFGFYPILIDGSFFSDSPVSRQYPQEMYYRLLAGQLLPETLHRILYLDPDILVINPLRPLWETDMKGCLFAAAAHTGKTDLASNINQIRLGTDHDYYNSGVLLIDLDKARKEIIAEDIFRYTKEHGKELLLPDQDLLNIMYGQRTLALADFIWNYDARNYNTYLLRSSGLCNMDWVMQNTAILHFCGKSKPWQAGYIHRFGILYKHYIQLTHQALNRLSST